jgi:flagellar biosynthesis GTPase FlhF
MEAALMKLLGAIVTTSLLLLFGSTAAAYAPQEQSDKPEKQDEKAKPEKQDEKAKPEKQEQQDKPAKQDAKQAKQEQQDKPAKQDAKQAKQEQQDKPAKQDAKQAKQEQQDKPVQRQDQKSAQQSQRDGSTRGSGDHGRISDDHYRASFGSGHNFHVNRGDYDHRRFDYGGYSFGFIDPWPVGWGYTDNVYVVYDDGAYYMYDVVHPGVRISVSIL